MRLAECIAEAGKWADVVGEEFEDYMHILKKINAQFHSKMLCELEDEESILLFLVET
jgi:hypothetical protein